MSGQRADAIECLAMLRAAFPAAPLSEETKRAYLHQLADVPADLLRRATDRAIKTGRFFPSVAELRSAAAGIAGVLPVSAERALATATAAYRSVWVCGRDGEPRWLDRMFVWPPDMPQAVERAAAVAGFRENPEGCPVFGWDQRFLGEYRRLAEEERVAALEDLPGAIARKAELEAPPTLALSPGFGGHPRVLPCGFVGGAEEDGARHDPACPTCAAWTWHQEAAAGIGRRLSDGARKALAARAATVPAAFSEDAEHAARAREIIGMLAAKMRTREADAQQPAGAPRG